ncbi:MAG: cation:proton antiporter [Candidatus Thermoplasmatota archaeon]|nr:cation:proton antiporter [Candidatus Thermoplasmatota archaeon]
MMNEAELLLQLGSIMLLAFIAATLAGKLNQSVMIGYIIIGAFIGPKMSLEILGFEYHGLITDTTIIELLSYVGLVMLMFFVGLEFSFTKLKKTRTPAIILAVIDTSVGLFVGFIFASYLGWPLIDSIFLAGVIAMSSTSIAMKVLFDLKRMSSPEVEFLIGLVVVETFIAMVILAVASGMIVQPSANPMGYGQLLISIVAFYVFFVWIAMYAVPRVVKFFNKIENDELFILFALGIVFLTSGVAAVMNVPPIIGAFFIGMILAESKVSARIQSKLESFKDVFVAIFFTSFGMMIDPAMFGNVLWMVVLAVPLVLVYEAFVMSSISYFLGFSAKASTTIGTSMSGRGIESILYASVGSKVQGATMGAQLNPFAGTFCFVMSAITPPLVKHSAKFANGLTKLVPKSLQFSGAVISRTLGKAVMPSNLPMFKGARMTAILLAAFVGVCIASLMTQSFVHVLVALAGLVLAGGVFVEVRLEIAEIARHVNYSNIGVGTSNKETIVDLVSGLIFGAVLSVLLIVFSWTYMWQFSLMVVTAYFVAVVSLMMWSYGRLFSEDVDFPQKVYHIPRPPLVDVAEPMPDIPKPVYGIVKAAQQDFRL